MMGRSKTAVDPARVDQGKTRRRIEDALRKGATAEDLVKIANVLGVEIATIPEVCPCSIDHRPYFGPDQVRCIHQLKKGRQYYRVGAVDRPYRESVVIVREPYFRNDRNGGWWIDVEFQGEYKGRKGSISLQDHNIFPYEGGHWNDSNHLAFSSTSKDLACTCCPHHHCPHHHCC